MPGVGEILDPRIVAEISDVELFHSANALVALLLCSNSYHSK